MKASAALSRLKLHESFGCSIQKSMVRMNAFERFVVFYGDEREPKPKIIENQKFSPQQSEPVLVSLWHTNSVGHKV